MAVVWVATALCGAAHGADASDMDRARKQLQEFLVQDPVANLAEAEQLAGSLREGGSWPDVDYASKDRSSWPTADHVERIVLVTKALRNTSANAVQREALANAVHSALKYWRQHDFKSANWFHNRIALPRKLCEIALILDEQHQPG